MKLPKIEYKKILYATDLSASGRIAFPYAASIAHTYGAELTVFHVAKPPEFEQYLVGYIDEELWKQIKTQDLDAVKDTLTQRKRDEVAVTSSVNEFCKNTLDEYDDHPYVAYDVKVTMGDPVTEIVREAESGDYDVVVVSKHSGGLIMDALMGTTARRVIRRCNRPVLVIPVPE
ncbi:MAG: universal stress protein [Gammaproteobacteria bacterium]|nr:universal stress protein [Gammaproteobacteria bacterium]